MTTSLVRVSIGTMTLVRIVIQIKDYLVNMHAENDHVSQEEFVVAVSAVGGGTTSVVLNLLQVIHELGRALIGLERVF